MLIDFIHIIHGIIHYKLVFSDRSFSGQLLGQSACSLYFQDNALQTLWQSVPPGKNDDPHILNKGNHQIFAKKDPICKLWAASFSVSYKVLVQTRKINVLLNKPSKYVSHTITLQCTYISTTSSVF